MLFFVFSKRKTKRETEAKDGTDACAKLTSVDSSGVFLSMASSVVLLSSSYYSRVRAVRVFFFAVSPCLPPQKETSILLLFSVVCANIHLQFSSFFCSSCSAVCVIRTRPKGGISLSLLSTLLFIIYIYLNVKR